MDKKILFLDLDGTLLNDQKEITAGNRQAINEALAQGHRIVVASGRPLKGSLRQANRLGLAGEGCYVIAYNGAVIHDCSTGKDLFRKPLDLDVLYAVFDEAHRRGIYIQTYDHEDVVVEPENDPETAARYCAMTDLDCRTIQNVRTDLDETPVKALMIDYQNPERLEGMVQWLRANLAGRADCFFSSAAFLEVVAAGMNKGAAVTELCRRLNIPIEHSLAAGDEANDISMIRAAGTGIAMANAIPAAKEAAGYVTQRDNNHDGIEEIIRKFLL